MKPQLIAAAFGVLCATPQLALAESFTNSFYCDGKLASVGDDSASVRLKCGTPMLVEKNEDACSKSARPYRCRTVEEWTYNLGPGKFLHTTVIENGKVIAIRQGARVE